jgi:hypothetical protein
MSQLKGKQIVILNKEMPFTTIKLKTKLKVLNDHSQLPLVGGDKPARLSDDL